MVGSGPLQVQLARAKHLDAGNSRSRPAVASQGITPPGSHVKAAKNPPDRDDPQLTRPYSSVDARAGRFNAR